MGEEYGVVEARGDGNLLRSLSCSHATDLRFQFDIDMGSQTKVQCSYELMILLVLGRRRLIIIQEGTS